MSLFRTGQKGLEKVPTKDFESEAALHKLMDTNLEALTGVRFLEAEYPIPGGRIETLGIDEHNVPVVVEYKKGQDPGAVVQGLFYLTWVTENRRSFEMIVREKMGAKSKVNWSISPRLIVIAKDFNARDVGAVRQIAATVELKKYAYYGDLLQIDDVTPVGKTERAKDEGAEDKQEKYTVDGLLKKAEPPVRELFLDLRQRILALPAVWEKVGSGYCDYRTTSTFANLWVQKRRLLIYIKMGDRQPSDPRDITEQKDFGLGRLNTRFELKPGGDVDYAMELIRQAHEYVT